LLMYVNLGPLIAELRICLTDMAEAQHHWRLAKRILAITDVNEACSLPESVFLLPRAAPSSSIAIEWGPSHQQGNRGEARKVQMMLEAFDKLSEHGQRDFRLQLKLRTRESDGIDKLKAWLHNIKPLEKQRRVSSLVTLCDAIARKGYEHSAVGTAFVMGDRVTIVDHAWGGFQVQETINVEQANQERTFLNFARVDGAQLIDNEGNLLQFMAQLAGYPVSTQNGRIGGTRHQTLMAWTERVPETIGVGISDGMGVVTIFQNGMVQWKSQPLYGNLAPLPKLIDCISL